MTARCYNDENDSFSQLTCDEHSLVSQVAVSIVDVRTGEKDKTMYVICSSLAHTDQEWIVQRCYSEFLELRTDLLRFFNSVSVNQCFGCRWFSHALDWFAFPRRRWINSRNVIHHRRLAFDRFVRMLAAHTFSPMPKCVNCSKLPFSRVRGFFLRDAIFPNHVSHKSVRSMLVPRNFAPISDPSKSKIEFRRGHCIWKVLQVEKPISSKRVEPTKTKLSVLLNAQLYQSLETESHRLSTDSVPASIDTTITEDDEN